jgi:hypothetical protein
VVACGCSSVIQCPQSGMIASSTSSTITREADAVLTNYLDFTLNHNRQARSYFLGADPGLAHVAKWSVESKGF